jgi:hypothetical protein
VTPGTKRHASEKGGERAEPLAPNRRKSWVKFGHCHTVLRERLCRSGMTVLQRGRDAYLCLAVKWHMDDEVLIK